jgi:hypothetical protein
MTTRVGVTMITVLALLGLLWASAQAPPVATRDTDDLLRSIVGGSAKLCDGGTWTCSQYLAEQGAACALMRQECGGCTPPTCLVAPCDPDDTLKKCGSPGTNCHGGTTCSGMKETGTCQWAGIETANDCNALQHWWICTYGPACVPDGGQANCARTWGCW